MNPYIRTFTGRKVNPLDLKLEDIDIIDIAHSLACQNRFCGHLEIPVSVAQHSVYVSRLSKNKLQGLLHDASEAYLGDVTKWLKMTPEFAAYREAEERAQKLIYQKFGCDTNQWDDVTKADVFMVRFEASRGRMEIDHPDYPPITKEEQETMHLWKEWGWLTSREIFLDTFNILRDIAI